MLFLALLLAADDTTLHWYSQWDFWVSGFTLLLVIATVWLAIETRTMRKDSIKAIEASTESAKSASRGADAAIESVRVAQQSLHLNLCAYVVVDRIEKK